MRLDEFESSQPEVGDILEIEIGNELVETVIVGINRGNYIVESTSTDLLESKLNEVNPHNYDSDLDYYDAVNRSGRRRNDDYEPADSGPTDDDIHYAKQRAQQQAQAKTAPVQKQSDDDGQAPNGERYNTVVTFTSPDNNRNKWAADSYKDYHWGAKKVVDSKEDNGVFTLYVVDNHKHGMWKPWKDQPAEGVAESYPAHQDLGGISTDKLKAYLAKYTQHPVPGEGNQVQRVRAELERRQQDVAEVSKATLDQYIPKAVDAHGHADFSARASKDDPTKRSYHVDQKKTAEKRRQGISRALDRMSKMEGVSESLNERAEKKEKVKVYVKNPKTGRVVKVDFGEPGQLIKKSKKHRKHGKKRWNLKK